MKDPIELAQVIRSNAVESIHYGHICLLDNRSRIKFWADANFTCFTRSCIKPIQAKISKDLLEAELKDEYLAIACGSHMAEEEQMLVVHKFMDKFNISASEIQCGSLSNSRGELSSNLKHNCSAKHIAIIAACKKQGWDSNKYLEAEHPYNQLLLEELKRLSGLKNIQVGNDDCGLPSFYMSLADMAQCFLNMSQDSEYEEIISTMNKFPFLIGGQKQIDSLLMNKYPNKFLAKGGAEGLMMVCNLENKQSLIIKIIDGSNRAKAVITSKVLEELGWIDEAILQSKTLFDSKSVAIGTIKSSLNLNFDKD